RAPPSPRTHYITFSASTAPRKESRTGPPRQDPSTGPKAGTPAKFEIDSAIRARPGTLRLLRPRPEGRLRSLYDGHQGSHHSRFQSPWRAGPGKPRLKLPGV